MTNYDDVRIISNLYWGQNANAMVENQLIDIPNFQLSPCGKR